MSNPLLGGGKEASRVSSRDSSRSNGAASRLKNAYRKRSSSTLNPLKKPKSRDADSDGTAVARTPKGFDGIFTHPEPGCRPKPPAELSESQEAKLADLLQHFRSKKTFPTSLKPGAEEEPPNDWEKLRMLSRESMLRYLRATKWDAVAAKKKLTDTIAWRREFGVDKIDPDFIEPEALCGKETVMGYDNYARPLHYMHPHRNDTKESPRQMQFAVWILERCIDLMPPGVEQLALLINFDKRSRNPTSISNAKLMLYILQNHYVERLGIALCINVPWVFKAFWSAIQGFIDPVTKSKCKFDEGIKEEVPEKQLSVDFGGSLDPQYNHDLYWPELVKLADQRRAKMLDRFRNQCNGEIGASEWVIRGGNDGKIDGSVPIHEEDAKAITEEAPQKAALARTESNKPAQQPTTQVSDPQGADDAGKSTDEQTADSAATAVNPWEEAIAKSNKRMSLGKAPAAVPIFAANGHQDDTDPAIRSEGGAFSPDSFQTPSEAISQNPLDRTFSKMSIAPPANSLAQMTIAEDSKNEAVKGDATTATTPTHARGISSTTDDKEKEGTSSAAQSPEAKEDSSTATKSPQQQQQAQSQQHHQHPFIAAMSKLVHHDGHSRPSSSHGHGGVTNGINGTSTPTSTSNPHHVKILFFAAAREAAGTSSLKLAFPTTKNTITLAEIPTLLQTVADQQQQSQGSGASGSGTPSRQDTSLSEATTSTSASSSNTAPSTHLQIKDLPRLLTILQRSSWSVGQNMISGDLAEVELKGGEEVAVIPPVSGG